MHETLSLNLVVTKNSEMANSPDSFDLKRVYTAFSECNSDDEKISISKYIQGYTELNKLLSLLGAVFNFVSKDVREKIGILRQHSNSSEGKHYETVQEMLDFEVTSGKTTSKSKPPSGSRTLLRLHRALAFISNFLERLIKMEGDASLTHVTWDAYKESLAKFHPWLIQKGVGIAVYTLPSRDQLLGRMKLQPTEETKTLVNDVIAVLNRVYEQVEQMYTDRDLHGLP